MHGAIELLQLKIAGAGMNAAVVHGGRNAMYSCGQDPELEGYQVTPSMVNRRAVFGARYATLFSIYKKLAAPKGGQFETTTGG
ncbi:hypothetical protein D3C83_148360 [compost metagenome]